MATIIIIILIIYIIVRLLQNSEAIGNWSHLFPNMQHDPESFYSLVEQVLSDYQIPGYASNRTTLNEGGILSHTRLYLEISRGDYIFHICAAPWGTGFFFSWWLRQKMSDIDQLLYLIPFFGPRLVKYRQYQTYYKLDTDAMFRKSVHQSILASIDQLTEAKGIRLTELERTPDLRPIIK